jgi:hypothetical protein
MPGKAEVINLSLPEGTEDKEERLKLESGREIRVTSGKEELIEICEPQGEVVMSVRLTASGPVVSVRGARLDIKAAQTISLEADRVKIKSRQEATIESEGQMQLSASKNMNLRSEKDVRVRGAMIHLN